MSEQQIKTLTREFTEWQGRREVRTGQPAQRKAKSKVKVTHALTTFKASAGNVLLTNAKQGLSPEVRYDTIHRTKA